MKFSFRTPIRFYNLILIESYEEIMQFNIIVHFKIGSIEINWEIEK